jgi:hypothetical protein
MPQRDHSRQEKNIKASPCEDMANRDFSPLARVRGQAHLAGHKRLLPEMGKANDKL